MSRARTRRSGLPFVDNSCQTERAVCDTETTTTHERMPPPGGTHGGGLHVYAPRPCRSSAGMRAAPSRTRVELSPGDASAPLLFFFFPPCHLCVCVYIWVVGRQKDNEAFKHYTAAATQWRALTASRRRGGFEKKDKENMGELWTRVDFMRRSLILVHASSLVFVSHCCTVCSFFFISLYSLFRPGLCSGI